jgi:hypothetical protein
MEIVLNERDCITPYFGFLSHTGDFEISHSGVFGISHSGDFGKEVRYISFAILG